jgi:glutamyl-Q tRNA(Asp) synthetase
LVPSVQVEHPGQAVLRFAPSPNGALHLGHARSALIAFEMAKRLGGRFLLRIEDIDTARTREEFVTGIYEDLAWLGLTWETPVLRQSLHFADYIAAAEKLQTMGLLYPCFATRAEILAAARPDALDPDGAPIYPGICRNLDRSAIARRKSAGQPFTMRLDMERALRLLKDLGTADPLTFTELNDNGRAERIAADPARWGDVVIQRRDVPTSYHLSVVIDDARQGVTHVTRGRDLFAATDVHRLLQALLELPEPFYHHHQLIMDEQGRKLAKSDGDVGLRELRHRGITPADIRRLVGLT